MKEKFYSFNSYLQKMFGQRVHRISLDAGFNCPNIDGKLSQQGCSFCNNKGFVTYAGKKIPLLEQIEKSIDFYSRRSGIRKFIAYFQSFSNTYATKDVLKEKYDIIKRFPEIVGLFISTRPDCIDEEKIKLIASYSKDYLVWIEYGLQTTHNHILKEINRNHSYEDFLAALDLTRKFNINVGVHIILGLPSLADEDTMEDAKRLANLDIQGIKFHLLHVLKDTALERIYRKGRLKLLSKNEYIKLVCDFLERIPSSLVILRLVSTALTQYLIAPLWINKKNAIITGITKELEIRATRQGRYFKKK